MNPRSLRTETIVIRHLPLRFMGRTLTATFTFVSDIFVHFSLPPCLYAPSYQCIVCESRRSPDFCQNKKSLVKQPQKSPDLEEKRWKYVHFSSFISIRARFLCKSSTLLQPQTASPPPSSTGSTTAILWQADWRRLCQTGGKDLRTAPLIGGEKKKHSGREM